MSRKRTDSGWRDISQEWDDPVFEAVAGELADSTERTLDLSALTAKQRFVVTRSWGLEGHDQYSYREIAEVMGISHIAVKGIHDRAIAKLRGVNSYPL